MICSILETEEKLSEKLLNFTTLRLKLNNAYWWCPAGLRRLTFKISVRNVDIIISKTELLTTEQIT